MRKKTGIEPRENIQVQVQALSSELQNLIILYNSQLNMSTVVVPINTKTLTF